MKATKAYIASLGTTGVLLGASILMLAVVSAVVAFDRWPNGNVSTRVQTLVLSEKPAPIRVSAAAVASSASAPTRAAAAVRTAAPRTTTIPALPGERSTGGHTGTPAAPATPGKGLPAEVTDPLKAVQPTTDPIFEAISNPSTTATQVANGAQSITDSAGVSVGRISPQLGGAVSDAGQTAADTVRQLPLPQHILPGR